MSSYSRHPLAQHWAVAQCVSLSPSRRQPHFQLWCWRQKQTLAAGMELMASLLGEEVRDFSEFHVSSQPAQPDHGGQQTADHRAVPGPRWRLFMRGIGLFPPPIIFLLLKAKKEQKSFNNMVFSNPWVQDKLASLRKKKSIENKVKNYDYSKHHIFFPTVFSLFSKLLKKDRLTDMFLNNLLYMTYLEIEINT